MKTIVHEVPPIDPAGVVYFGKAEERGSALATERSQAYAGAERRMQRGQRLVVTGFVLALLGVALYCVACFGVGVSGYAAVSSPENAEWAIEAALWILGLGTVLWLVGLFGYLGGAMDSDPEGSVHRS